MSEDFRIPAGLIRAATNSNSGKQDLSEADLIISDYSTLDENILINGNFI
jgi:hypothetical protein